MVEFKYNSFDSKELVCYLWDDVKDPIGVVQIVHGMEECGLFYEEFALCLNKRGYIVLASDLRAHGKTETDENRGNDKGNIYANSLKDIELLNIYLKDKYNLPIFVFGHSYGSFLLQGLSETNTIAKALALSGSGYVKTRNILRVIGLLPMWLFAKNAKPKFVNYASDHRAQFPGDSGLYQWINSVKERREDFVNGKYAKFNHIDMSFNFSFYATYGPIKVYTKKGLSKLNKNLAIGIFSGKDDINANNGKSIEQLNKMYLDNGVKSEYHLYEGSRHDVLFDREAEKVQSDIADFFDKFI